MTDKITSKKASWTLLITSVISGVGGALLLGHILDKVTRITFQLSTDSYDSIIIPSILILFFGIFGTAVLIISFFIENKGIRVTTIAFSVIIPIIIEIVDILVRSYFIYIDFSNMNPYLLAG